MLREKHEVHANKRDPKVQAADAFIVVVAEYLREPVIPAAENGEHGAKRQHIMEMGNHIIGVVENTVDGGIGQDYARDATNGEEKDETDSPEHGCAELDRAAPHCGDPGEYLDAGRHRDHHGGGDEIGLSVDVETDGEHVMGPDDETDDPDRHHGVRHAEIAEHRLFRERGHNLADHSEAGENQNVDFRMAEEPEQMLEENRIAAGLGNKKAGAKIAVGQKHGDGSGQNRQSEQQQKHGNQDRPNEQWHLMHGHAGGAHVEDRGYEVDRAKNGGSAGDMNRQNGEIHCRTALTRQGRV